MKAKHGSSDGPASLGRHHHHWRLYFRVSERDAGARPHALHIATWLDLGMDLVTDRETKQRGGDEARGGSVQVPRTRGVSLKTIDGNVLTLKPALVILAAAR